MEQVARGTARRELGLPPWLPNGSPVACLWRRLASASAFRVVFLSWDWRWGGWGEWGRDVVTIFCCFLKVAVLKPKRERCPEEEPGKTEWAFWGSRVGFSTVALCKWVSRCRNGAGRFASSER